MPFEVAVISGDYVISNAVLDPYTRENIVTMIVKDNLKIKFRLLDYKVVPESLVIENYYYTSYNDQNIKIKCIDRKYIAGENVDIIPKKIYDILLVKKKLNKCLFVQNICYDKKIYDEKDNVIGIEKENYRFNFKIVDEKEFDAYKNLTKKIVIKNDTIKKPKKVID